jgi:predicted transposase YbfD/YdcC
VTQDIDWLKKLHPEWQELRGIATITATPFDKKTRKLSTETRFYTTSLAADAPAILMAIRAHWTIYNNLHWRLDITFDQDFWRTRKDFSAMNLAIFRHAVLNMLKRSQTQIFKNRKRVKAAVDPAFQAQLLAF